MYLDTEWPEPDSVVYVLSIYTQPFFLTDEEWQRMTSWNDLPSTNRKRDDTQN